MPDRVHRTRRPQGVASGSRCVWFTTMSQGNVPSFVANIVATEQPLCVANVIKLTKSIADLSQYRDQPLIAAKEPEKRPLIDPVPQSIQTPPATAHVPPPSVTAVEVVTISEPSSTAATSSDSASKTEALSTEIQGMLSGTTAASHGQLLLDPCMFNTKVVREGCIPSANGHFTASALAKLMAVLGHGGQLGSSRRILSDSLSRDIARVRSLERRAFHTDVQWGLGVRRFT